MQHTTISYSDTGRFSTLMSDYLAQHKDLKPFYGRFPNVANFEKQAKEKLQLYPSSTRKTLVEVLKKQYETIENAPKVHQSITLLSEENSVTVTTGHQLCLMTGPLFFIYKIITTIKAAYKLSKKYPEFNFIPVYWMASEDHDFEEIQSFLFKGKKIQWNSEQEGRAVGTIQLDDLDPLLDLFEQHLGSKPSAETLKKWIAISYRNSSNLAEATRKFVHFLFQDYSLVVVDANDFNLKKLFVPAMAMELKNQKCFESVATQTQNIKKTYNEKFVPQVNPRPINLFYLTSKDRYLIRKEENHYYLEDSDKKLSEKEMLNELEEHPERFSPNVLMRPLYQETILPNVGYIGGGGELAYWFQLNHFFETHNIPFPILVLRNSALLLSEKTAQKLNRLDISTKDCFLPRVNLINKKIRQISNIDLDLGFLKKQLEKQFDYLEGLVAQTDPSFEGALKAQLAKQNKGIEALEKRLLQAQKRKLKDQVQRMTDLHKEIFPNDALQERQLNVVEFYLDHGGEFINALMKVLDPFSNEFSVIKY